MVYTVNREGLTGSKLGAKWFTGSTRLRVISTVMSPRCSYGALKVYSCNRCAEILRPRIISHCTYFVPRYRLYS